MPAACSHAGGASPIAEMFVSFDPVQPEALPQASPPAEVVEEPRLGMEGCKDTVAEQAKRHGAIHVEAEAVGRPNRVRNGVTEVQLDATVFYQKDNVVQYRDSRITCQFDKAGNVLALR